MSRPSFGFAGPALRWWPPGCPAVGGAATTSLGGRLPSRDRAARGPGSNPNPAASRLPLLDPRRPPRSLRALTELCWTSRAPCRDFDRRSPASRLIRTGVCHRPVGRPTPARSTPWPTKRSDVAPGDHGPRDRGSGMSRPRGSTRCRSPAAVRPGRARPWSSWPAGRRRPSPRARRRRRPPAIARVSSSRPARVRLG